VIPNLPFVEDLACQAGDILRAGFGKKMRVDYKGVIDLVTEMDHRSEQFLVDGIRRHFPDHQVITEEAGILPGMDSHTWYIDPLDGTINYAHGIPIYTVSVAYAENGQVIYGVVYDPMQRECFRAARGEGAWLNDTLLHVSTPRSLDQSLLVTGFPYDIRTHPENNLDHYANFSLCSQGVRRFGSAALDLGYIAAGRVDGFWEIRINPWDVAAGGLIAEEAGSKVTNIYGSPDYIVPPCSILAASPIIHAQMLDILNQKSSSAA
jgi:myo-inositol-1(or 4)-monophosphatase